MAPKLSEAQVKRKVGTICYPTILPNYVYPIPAFYLENDNISGDLTYPTMYYTNTTTSKHVFYVDMFNTISKGNDVVLNCPENNRYFIKNEIEACAILEIHDTTNSTPSFPINTVVITGPPATVHFVWFAHNQKDKRVTHFVLRSTLPLEETKKIVESITCFE